MENCPICDLDLSLVKNKDFHVNNCFEICNTAIGLETLDIKPSKKHEVGASLIKSSNPGSSKFKEHCILGFMSIGRYTSIEFGVSFPHDILSLLLRFMWNCRVDFALGLWKNRLCYDGYKHCTEEDFLEYWEVFQSEYRTKSIPFLDKCSVVSNYCLHFSSGAYVECEKLGFLHLCFLPGNKIDTTTEVKLMFNLMKFPNTQWNDFTIKDKLGNNPFIFKDHARCDGRYPEGIVLLVSDVNLKKLV